MPSESVCGHGSRELLCQVSQCVAMGPESQVSQCVAMGPESSCAK